MVGLLMTLKAHKVYIASVLLFVGQLEELPPDFNHTEAAAIRRLVPGPRGWITAGVLKQLRSLGGSESLKDVATTVAAAKARVSRFEAGGRLCVLARGAALSCLSCASTDASLARLAWFHAWRDRSFLGILARAALNVQALQRSLPSVPQWVLKTGWQKFVAELLYNRSHVPADLVATTHLRRRLDRWPLQLLPGRRLAPAVRILELVGRRCQPRVWAAALRLWCDG